jgi:hypothetical protein
VVLAFTGLEIIIIVVIILVVVGYILWRFTRKVPATITGAWTTAPATVNQPPATGTFVFTVTSKIGAGPATPFPNRPIAISTAPPAGTHIVSVTDGSPGSPMSYALTPATTSVSAMTDALGTITVTLMIDFVGNASITATDAKFGPETALYQGV